ncbi:hypothetical protein ACFOG5_02125 [Pedobacter fastidiosus]|uniref:Uncharacterized protein n=1 Tax=Pedobacter fastidiosus TaxID=2765361 RepID=A0ABR7KRU5_9SPHI|nr:hypothetical protein [Pedobacter fastidiosus]MBC6110770.1 hypothetical protein [Pedobacter fastidiosus]
MNVNYYKSQPALIKFGHDHKDSDENSVTIQKLVDNDKYYVVLVNGRSISIIKK